MKLTRIISALTLAAGLLLCSCQAPKSSFVRVEDGKFGLELTQEILDAALTQQYWGGAFLLNGDNIKCTKVTLL